MSHSIFYIEVVPFLLRFVLLMGSTILGDWTLHQFNLVWIGRYLGIPGTMLILLSLIYSLRKRKVILSGSPQILLKMHEWFTWLGALLVFVHSGVHFNAWLPWLTTMALTVNVISGLVGRYLLIRSRRHLAERRKYYQQEGLASDAIDKALFWDAVTYNLMVKWRVVHFPISYLFACLAVGHIVTIFLFWEWR